MRAEHAWIEIVLLPVTITDNRDRRVVAGRFLFRQKCTASRQRNAEDGKIVRSDDGTERTAGIAFLAEANKREVEPHYVTEDGVLLANVEISRIGKSAEFFRILLVLGKELDHFVRFGIGRRGKEKPVHQTENGSVHANAEREYGYRCNRERRRLEKLPNGKPKVLNHAIRS